MELLTVNWLGVILSFGVCFVLGALWYSPVLFGKTWMKEVGHTEESIKESGMFLPMFTQAISTFLLTLLVFKVVDFGGYPLLILLVIAFTGMEKAKALFQGESIKLISIDISYRLVIFLVATIFQIFF